jgi:hypothetical protein
VLLCNIDLNIDPHPSPQTIFDTVKTLCAQDKIVKTLGTQDDMVRNPRAQGVETYLKENKKEKKSFLPFLSNYKHAIFLILAGIVLSNAYFNSSSIVSSILFKFLPKKLIVDNGKAIVY